MNPRDPIKARYFEDEASKVMGSLSKYFSCLYLDSSVPEGCNGLSCQNLMYM